MDQSFVDLLNGTGGATQGWVDIDEYNQLADEPVHDNPTEEHVPTGPKRKLNFSDEEDKALSKAWLSVGLDPITGNQQRGSTYWARIHEEFEIQLGRTTDRTESSLIHRWQVISSLVSKYQACSEAIEKRRASGTTIDDKNVATHEMFKRLHKKPFTLMACYVLLRPHPKWNSRLTLKKAKKNLTDSPGSSCTPSFSLKDDAPRDEREMERPIGTKAAKAKKKELTGRTIKRQDWFQNKRTMRGFNCSSAWSDPGLILRGVEKNGGSWMSIWIN